VDLGISGRVALVTGGARSLGQADATVPSKRAAGSREATGATSERALNGGMDLFTF
jgi:NAD(P)-dependent dehydrogenase (short-subunit alcohol dehydrogenase family)